MRTKKVNKRLVGWEKLLNKLTEYTCAVALSKEDRVFGTAVRGCSFHMGRSPTAFQCY